MWTKTEGQLLVQARSMDGEFSRAKSHKTLWQKISEDLKKGVTVTGKQCEN